MRSALKAVVLIRSALRIRQVQGPTDDWTLTQS